MKKKKEMEKLISYFLSMTTTMICCIYVRKNMVTRILELLVISKIKARSKKHEQSTTCTEQKKKNIKKRVFILDKF